MAGGGWIKMRWELAGDEAVIGIASALKLDEHTVVGKLHCLWSWADRESRNGHVPCVTQVWVDRYVGAPGFADAMAKQGWLVIDPKGATFPDFDVHMSGWAKKRGLATKRQSRKRSRKSHTEGVTRSNSICNSSSLKGGVGGKRKPDLIWDTVEELYFGGQVVEGQQKVCGKLVSFLKKKGATPAELRLRRQRLVDAWGAKCDTRNAIREHWDEFDGRGPQPSRPGRATAPPGKYDGR